MGKLYCTKKIIDGASTKIFFASYLRKDFVERSMVVTLNKDHIVSENIFFIV